MTYNEFINSIIETRGQWSDEVRYSSRGCERHHIIPRCMGGKPLNLTWSHHENIIWLYPSEHFDAHLLLAKENQDNFYLLSALVYMQRLDSNCNKKYIITSGEEYEKLRSKFYSMIGEHNKQIWESKSEEEKNKINSKRSATMNEPNNYNKMVANVKEAIRKRTPEQEAERKRKEKETKSKRTQEEIDDLNNRKRMTMLNKTPEQKAERKRKEAETKAKWTPEERERVRVAQSEGMKGKLYYNNGTIQGRWLEGQQPKGWVHGKLPLSTEKEAKRKRKERETKIRTGRIKNV